MHEYVTLYGHDSRYKECIDCNKRTPHICFRCNYCYSCHFKIERTEKEYWLERVKIIPANGRQRRDNHYPVAFTTYATANKRKWVQPSMGRTVPSFRIASVMEEMEWRPFRNSLDKSDRKKFDQMFSFAHLYNSASSYAANPFAYSRFLCLSYFTTKHLVKLSEEINKM